MLRITTILDRDPVPLLLLAGKLVGPWLDELSRAVAAATGAAGPPELDLASLYFVDGPGERLLRGLLQRGCRLVACSGYVAELLQGETQDP